ncbi:zincin [Ceraceosorus guamensis]|uniref:mitochondrial intermediate peptidase n=1 Tax=Ceraceosorus guamensis TaxID=1522189 RepID=A0A316VSY5_9BASI|nr:zincin [Ceraceosorus guamensis]PWN39321.1 zincin [Ceraceosorus guamensis]
MFKSATGVATNGGGGGAAAAAAAAAAGMATRGCCGVASACASASSRPYCDAARRRGPCGIVARSPAGLASVRIGSHGPVRWAWMSRGASRSASTSRSASQLQATGANAPTHPHTHATSTYERDDEELRAVLDAPTDSSLASSSRATPFYTRPPSGLFRLPSFSSPSALPSLVERTIARSQLLVQRISLASLRNDAQELKGVVRLLDRLSDTLCRVIDACELIRNVHPDAQWAESANDAYEQLCHYMNVLNTSRPLYDAVSLVLADASLRASLSPEALSVGQAFQKDFEKSGIHLQEASRKKFVDLSSDLVRLGRQFLSPTLDEAEERGLARFIPEEHLSGLPAGVKAALRQADSGGGGSSSSSSDKGQGMFVPVASWQAQLLLKYAPDQRARRTAYEAMHGASQRQVQVLEEMLRKRAQLANVTGFESFAELTLGDKMAKNPKHVDEFLAALDAENRFKTRAKLAELLQLKQQQQGASSGAIAAWDRDYYSQQYLRSISLQSSTTPISPFYSVGTLFSGLSKLLQKLYGLRFRVVQTDDGEVWEEGVKRIEVMNESEELVGVIYADLFSRQGKAGGAAHYTVRCSRRTDVDDLAGDLAYGLPGAPIDELSLQEKQEMQKACQPLEEESFSVAGKEGKYQLPVVVLICDFVRPTVGQGPTLLSWNEVETLFHEMGHAVHSMLGRTEYHQVSGTRCATDFVELPSILMEHFISCPSVTSLIARHHSTGSSLAYSTLRKHVEASRSLEAIDTHQQILLAQLDQAYHTSNVLSSDFSSDQTLADLHARQSLLTPSPSSVHSQAHFGHLVGYASTYYSYLFDRAIASKVWQKIFAKDPLDRRAGEEFREKVLKWGGGRDPWEALADLLKDDEIAKGDSRAMQIVGRWGIANVGVEAPK